MKGGGARRIADALATVALPVVATAAWIRWALGAIAAQEREIRPLSGLAYATFVQLAHSWGEGLGWRQTVHVGYAEDWRWGGHYTPLLFVAAKLASLSDSPWALARVQAVAVGLGCLAAWKLGRDEARWPGAVAGLAMYALSGPVALLALADYQDLVLTVPLTVLAVWAARHARPAVFVVCAALLGATREEALVLLPLVGLSGGLPRALLGAAVSAAYLLVYRGLGPPPYPNPLLDIAGWMAGPAHPPPVPNWHLYGVMSAPAWPWLLLAPVTALGTVPVAYFHASDPTGVGGIASPAIHHLAPLTAVAIAAGIVGACRPMRLGRAAAVATLGVVLVASGLSVHGWSTPLRTYGVRVRGTGEHPAWGLLARVPSDDAIFVPEEVAPAAARRARVVTRDSLGDRVPATQVRWALDDGRLQGDVVAEDRGWRLLSDPELPAVRRPGPPSQPMQIGHQ